MYYQQWWIKMTNVLRFVRRARAGTKETAFVYAATSAGVAHAVTAACSAGNLTDCSCDSSREGDTAPDGWKWGGCSDNIRYGLWFAESFVDAPDRDRQRRHGVGDVRALMNLHNNEVGRKVFSISFMIDDGWYGEIFCTHTVIWTFRTIGYSYHGLFVPWSVRTIDRSYHLYTLLPLSTVFVHMWFKCCYCSWVRGTNSQWYEKSSNRHTDPILTILFTFSLHSHYHRPQPQTVSTISSPSASPPGCLYSVIIFVVLPIPVHFFIFIFIRQKRPHRMKSENEQQLRKKWKNNT